MATPTKQQLEDLIDRAYDEKRGSSHTPSFDLDNVLNTWASIVTNDGGWERWPCENENCPARPAWNDALDEVYADMVQDSEAIVALVTKQWAKRLAAFVAKHPEAPWQERLIADRAE